jgi:hypothetical protein
MRAGDLKELQSWVSTNAEHRDVTISPATGRTMTTLIKNAFERRLPYVTTHDWDHAWASRLSRADERAWFEYCLNKASGTTARLRTTHWQTLRRGLYSHGWSLDARSPDTVHLIPTATIPLMWIEPDDTAKAIHVLERRAKHWELSDCDRRAELSPTLRNRPRTMSGYSGTPLPKKLGIKPRSRLLLLNAPAGFDETLGDLPADVTTSTRPTKQPADIIVLLCKDLKALTTKFENARAALHESGGLWIAWPKKSSGVKSDLTEDIIRDLALAAGLVDNKVCAIDETWSGLRLVVRLKDRKKK